MGRKKDKASRPASQLRQPLPKPFQRLFAVLDELGPAAPVDLVPAVRALPSGDLLPPPRRAWKLIDVANDDQGAGEEDDDEVGQYDDADPGEGGEPRTRHSRLGEEDDDEVAEVDEGDPWASPGGRLVRASGLGRGDPSNWARSPVASALIAEFGERETIVRGFARRWRDVRERAWLATMIGDWPTAHAAALTLGDKGLVAEVGPRAERWIRRRPTEAVASLAEFGCWTQTGTIKTLAANGVKYARDVLRRAIASEGAPGSTPGSTPGLTP